MNIQNVSARASPQYVCPHMGQFPQGRENEQNVSYFFLIFEALLLLNGLIFQVFSTVLKRLCPLESENTFVLV